MEASPDIPKSDMLEPSTSRAADAASAKEQQMSGGDFGLEYRAERNRFLDLLYAIRDRVAGGLGALVRRR